MNRTRRGNGTNNNNSSEGTRNNAGNNFSNFNYEGEGVENLDLNLEGLHLNNNNNRPRTIRFANYANQTNFKFNAATNNFGATSMVPTRRNGRKRNVPRIAFNNNRAAANNLNEEPLAVRIAKARAEAGRGVNLPRANATRTAENYANRKNLTKLASMAYSSNNSAAVNEVKKAYTNRTTRNAKKARNLALLNQNNAAAANA